MFTYFNKNGWNSVVFISTIRSLIWYLLKRQSGFICVLTDRLATEGGIKFHEFFLVSDLVSPTCRWHERLFRAL